MAARIRLNAVDRPSKSSMSMHASPATFPRFFVRTALHSSGAHCISEHCSIYSVYLSAAPRRRGDHQTSPAQPVIKMAALAFPKRLAGKKVAIFIDYQFEDLEVTFPMLRSVHKSNSRVRLHSLVALRTGYDCRRRAPRSSSSAPTRPAKNTPGNTATPSSPT